MRPEPRRPRAVAPSGGSPLRRPVWHTRHEVVLGLIFFALLGFTLGYAVAGRGAWFGLLVPVAFALLTGFTSGWEFRLLVVLFIALLVTAAAIIAGALLDRRLSRRGQEA